nr:unnamed protein product [Digitaria exilis]
MGPSPSSVSGGDLRFDTYAALVALAVAAILAALFWRLYKLTVSARPQDMAHVSPGAGENKQGALRRRDVAALPVFVVHAAAAATALECAVCLEEVRDGERWRLLPRCGHRFHVECIDRWFRAHSTCPICRAEAVGQTGVVEPHKVVVVVQS